MQLLREKMLTSLIVECMQRCDTYIHPASSKIIFDLRSGYPGSAEEDVAELAIPFEMS